MMKLKKKIVSNRFILIILAFFMFALTVGVGAINVGYSAEVTGLNDELASIIELDADKQGVWSANKNTISGSVTTKKEEGGCFDDATYTSDSSTLTLTYTGTEEGYLSFNFTLVAGKRVTLDEREYTSDVGEETSFKKSMNANNNKLLIKLESPDDTDTSSSIYINSLEFEKINFNLNVTFLLANGGSYYVNDVLIENETNLIFDGNETFNLRAVPYEGYKFVGWYFNDVLSYENIEIDVSVNSNTRIYPYFIDEDCAVFSNNGKDFYNLNDAISSAQQSTDKIILLKESGSLIDNATYILTSGITLYIPNDSSIKIYNDNTFIENEAKVTPSIYKELIILENTELIIDSGATLYVAAKASSQSWAAISGPYGRINILSGGKITLKNNSKLFSYGYIIGDGIVNAENGSEVHEIFQFRSWFGADESLEIMNDTTHKVFPINQYYVQNIECYLRINYNVQLVVHTGVSVMNFWFHSETSMNFLGKEGIFTLLNENSYLLRKYDSQNDKVNYDIYGEVNISPITLELKVAARPFVVESKNYVLPVNNNFVINVLNDSTVTISQDLCLLPGVELNIKFGGTLTFIENVSLYVYDTDVWINKKYTSAGNLGVIQYVSTLGKAPSRTMNSNSPDATININGLIKTNNGASIYTTLSYESDGTTVKGAANIYSSEGTGKIMYISDIGSITETFQYTNRNGSMEPESIPVAPSYLKNGDGTYFIPTDECSGKTVFYNNEPGVQKRELQENEQIERNIIFKDSNSSIAKSVIISYTVGEEFTFPYAYDSRLNFTNPNGYSLKRRYIFNLGYFSPGDKVVLGDYTNDITAIAIWGGRIQEENSYKYIDYNSGNYLKGLNKVQTRNTKDIKIHLFDENGIFLSDYNGFYDANDNKKYYLELGIVQENVGLTTISSPSGVFGEYEYIYIDVDNSVLTNGTYYISNTNNLLPSGNYTFDSSGYIVKEDTTSNRYDGEHYIKDDVTYIDGIRVSLGLFINNNHYSYSDNNGNLVKSKTYYVSKTNSLGINKGLYYFDENGFMYDENFNVIEVNSL